jgi:cytochrome c-type biogenesis protein CcmH
LSPELEAQAVALERKVIAPCCWSQQVSVHDSPAATQMRQDIRRRLGAGQTEQVILAAYVAEHGERILAEPPATGFTSLLYVGPYVLGLAGIVVLIVMVRRFTQRAAATPAVAGAGAPVPAGSHLDRRLDDELRDLD